MHYLHFFFYSSISLHHKHLPSNNSGHICVAGTEEDSCLQHTLISPPFCPSPGLQPLPDPISLLTASQGSEWLIPDVGPKYTRDTMKGAASCLFSVPPVSRKLYNTVFQHRYLVCKLLPHVHRVSADQEVQPIMITIPKSVWAFLNMSACRMRTLNLQKMLRCFKR